ncbi:hypothetical protein Ahy_B05g074324 [Arachis hypogaea]|uniref:At2g35280-like TPR domain-containing protein n=1 Tax=Arachis hypogaea TaxID=3818 RepID=A0A444YYI4_ARAHY|nr:hypothetical protein Ahy_B05g074324 [Arachis hypogaea]
MAGGSMKNRKKRNAAKKIGEKGTVSVEYECLLNLLPHDIWVKIATKVASYSIKDLFNMQVTSKVFLGAARSDAVYKEASMLELPIASFLYYYGCLENRSLERCAEARNPAALLRVGMTEFVWIGHCIDGMDTLTMAATEGDLEACYMCAMLLLSNGKEDEEHMRKGLEFFEIVRDSGALERCREVFAGRWVEVKPFDPGQPEVCRSTSCCTRGTMGDVEDLSHVSCVQCLADYEVRGMGVKLDGGIWFRGFPSPRRMHIADGFRSTNPFFVMPIVDSIVTSRMLPNVPPLPKDYEDSPISITNERGAWTVQYRHYPGRMNGCFGTG